MSSRGQLLLSIAHERERQDELKAAGKFSKTCADDMLDPEKLAVLAEEFGEVARLVCESVISIDRRNPRELMKELTQVAAVCLAWCEALREEIETPFEVIYITPPREEK